MNDFFDFLMLQTPQNEVWFSRGHNVAGKTTLYDMEVSIESFVFVVSIYS